MAGTAQHAYGRTASRKFKGGKEVCTLATENKSLLASKEGFQDSGRYNIPSIPTKSNSLPSSLYCGPSFSDKDEFFTGAGWWTVSYALPPQFSQRIRSLTLDQSYCISEPPTSSKGIAAALTFSGFSSSLWMRSWHDHRQGLCCCACRWPVTSFGEERSGIASTSGGA